MRKSNKSIDELLTPASTPTARSLATLAVPDSIVKFFAEQGEVELSHEKSAAAFYRTEIADLNRRIVISANDLKQIEDRITKISKTIDHSEDLEKAQAFYDSLIAYKWVEGITVDAEYIVVKTKLIFGDIRKEAGSDVHGRACLGAFELRFSLLGHSYYIKNLTFAGIYDTWSVRDCSPCLGDWGEDFRKRSDTKDYAGLIDIMYHYIRAADTDGSSYMPSNRWRDQRMIAGADSILANGTRVIITQDYDDSDCECALGTITRAESGSHSSYYVEFQDEQEWDGDEHSSWWFPDYCLAPITQAQFDSGEADVEPSDRIKTIKKIDALPDGTTQADVEKIIKAAIKKTK